jgi:hypothetical protein
MVEAPAECHKSIEYNGFCVGEFGKISQSLQKGALKFCFEG